jgi:hypothetical protein
MVPVHFLIDEQADTALKRLAALNGESKGNLIRRVLKTFLRGVEREQSRRRGPSDR